ncbi:hypothetical protein [Desulfurococcus mucosus]|uniref:Archaeal Type IV pilin N-terminal domain-containing protein n=1 Tax=Desulfurococcus mucosus (strain ATCC 35584 / DSM 2162 / JCM 9187 / O7/1) TaxID=765177 RepID=E8R8X9_DESM0|nr:hypothetical protein [Desulfurococcus mucosus]ADV64955.1 hypothetical protein Desmu_0647 [Desulfurococcus mucosus DSM 2162]
MKSDGEVIGLVVIVTLAVFISIAFAFWIQGNPFLNTGIDIVVIAHSIDPTSNGWRIWLMVGNKGSQTASIEYILLNDRVCSVTVNVTRGNSTETHVVPGEPIPLEPGESVELSFNTNDLKECSVTITHGVYLKITLRTSQGRDFFREFTVP